MLLLSIGIFLSICMLLTRYKKAAYIGFFIVFFVMAFQYNPTTDYIRYQASFEQMQILISQNEGVFYQLPSRAEPGWQMLYNLFAWASFPFFVFCVALFQYFVLVRLTKTYVDVKYQFLTPILFYFTDAFMLMQTTAMRQGLAIELCLLSFFLVNKKKYVWAVILAGLAFSVHKTALLGGAFVGLYFLLDFFKLWDIKVTRNDYFWPVVFALIFIFLYLFKESIIDNTLAFFSSDDDLLRDYSYNLNSLEFKELSPLIILYDCVMVFVNVLYYKYAEKQQRFFIIASTIACFCDMLFFGLGSIPRIFLYFSIFNILLYPNIAKFIAEKYGKIVSVVYIVFCVGYSVKTFIPAVMPPEGYYSFYEFVFLT